MAEDVKIRLLLETREARSQVQRFSKSLEDANEEADGLSRALKDTALSAAKVGASQVAGAFGGAFAGGGGFGGVAAGGATAAAQGIQLAGEAAVAAGGPLGVIGGLGLQAAAGFAQQEIQNRQAAAAEVAARFAPLEQAGVEVGPEVYAQAFEQALLRVERARAAQNKALGVAFDPTR